MFDPVATELIESWRQFASLARRSLQLEIQSNSPLPATAPVRHSTGWTMVYPAGTAYHVALEDSLVITLPAPEPRDEPELLLWAGPVTAMAMWCAGILPLHAVGFRVGEKVAAVVAPPGGGKSTLAALAGSHAIPLMGDDLLGITEYGMVLPRFGSLRIRPPMAPHGVPPDFMLSDGRGWFSLMPTPPTRLGSLLILRRGAIASLSQVTGRRKLGLFLSAGFLSRYDSQVPPQWEAVLLDFCAYLPVWELQVPDGLVRLGEAWPEIHSLIQQSLS